MATITLTGKEVLKLKKIDSEPKQDKNGKDYWRFAKGVTVFTAGTEFANEWTKGNVAELDLDEYEDRAEDGTTIKRLAAGGFITNTQELAVVTHQAQVQMVSRKLEKEFSLANVAETA